MTASRTALDEKAIGTYTEVEKFVGTLATDIFGTKEWM
jgi:hypothetical protein